jgi:hypothetical protein
MKSSVFTALIYLIYVMGNEEVQGRVKERGE